MKHRASGQVLKDRRQAILDYINQEQEVSPTSIKYALSRHDGSLHRDLLYLVDQGKILHTGLGQYRRISVEDIHQKTVGSVQVPAVKTEERKTLTPEITAQIRKYCNQRNLVFINFIEETMLERLIKVDVKMPTKPVSPIASSRNTAKFILEYLRKHSAETFTSKELGEIAGIHTSSVSGRLTELFKMGYLCKTGIDQNFYRYQITNIPSICEVTVHDCILKHEDFISKVLIADKTRIRSNFVLFCCNELCEKKKIIEVRPWVYQKYDSDLKSCRPLFDGKSVMRSVIRSPEISPIKMHIGKPKSFWEKIKSFFS